MAQTQRIDSLRQALYRHTQQDDQLKTAIALCSQYGSLHPDSLLAHIRFCKQLARPNSREDLMLGHFISIYHSRKGKIDSAIAAIDEALANTQIQQDIDLLLRFKMARTGMFIRQNKLKEALDNALQILNQAEKENQQEYKVKAETQIGWVNMELGQWQNALQWLFKASNSNKLLNIPVAQAVICSNIAAVYNSLGKNDSALHFVNQSIQLATQSQELVFLCNGHYIRSDVNTDLGNLKAAELDLNEGLAIRQKIGDPFYITADLAQLAKFYTKTKQYPKSENAAQEGIAIARKYKLDQKLLFLYSTLAESYKAANKLEAYSQTLNTIIGLKDTLYNQNSALAMQDLQARYELEKKENTINQQKLSLLYKNYWMYGALLLLIFGALLWAVNYRHNKRKQAQELAMAVMQEKQQAEKAILIAEEKERKRIAADLHDNLGAYAAAIAANADYLLQQNQQTAEQAIASELHNNAQAIVAQLNDTIWVLTKETLALTAISDRLKNFIQRLQKSYPQLQADVTENIGTDHLLAPAQALHLFKILQEAIVNAVRHSGGNRITINIESNQHWQITITDNGVGMPTHLQSATGGHGLHNMRQRAAAAGWQIAWQPATSGGTTVLVSATTTN